MSKRMTIIVTNDSHETVFEASFEIPARGVEICRIIGYGDRKIACIKRLREATGCDLREAKARIESLPQDITGLSKKAASDLADHIRCEGGDAETRDSTGPPLSLSFEAKLFAAIGEEYLRCR
jgi:ribosomal protein L7/L12